MAIILPKKEGEEKPKERKPKNGYNGHIVFQNEVKKCDRYALVGINLLCKFGEFMLINKVGVKLFIEHDEWMHRRMDRGRAFYNLPSRAYWPVGGINCAETGRERLKSLTTLLSPVSIKTYPRKHPVL